MTKEERDLYHDPTDYIFILDNKIYKVKDAILSKNEFHDQIIVAPRSVGVMEIHWTNRTLTIKPDQGEPTTITTNEDIRIKILINDSYIIDKETLLKSSQNITTLEKQKPKKQKKSKTKGIVQHIEDLTKEITDIKEELKTINHKEPKPPEEQTVKILPSTIILAYLAKHEEATYPELVSVLYNTQIELNKTKTLRLDTTFTSCPFPPGYKCEELDDYLNRLWEWSDIISKEDKNHKLKLTNEITKNRYILENQLSDIYETILWNSDEERQEFISILNKTFGNEEKNNGQTCA